MMNDQSQATAALEPETQEPEAQPSGNEGSFFIPKDIIGERGYENGDKITLEVMGTDEDGDLEVCFPGTGGDWRSELKTELNQAGGQNA